MARALGRSRLLAEAIDREQVVVEDAQSTLLVDLSRIAAADTAREAEAAAAARRSWWAEARECLLGLLSSSHGGSGGGGGSKRARASLRSQDGDSGGIVCDGGSAGVGAPASEVTVPRPATSSLGLVRSRLEKVEAAAAVDASAAAGIVGGGDGEEGGGSRPLHLAVKKQQHRSDEAIRRCADAIEAARSDPRAWGGDSSIEQTTAATASPAVAGEEEENSSTVSSRDVRRGGEYGHREKQNNRAPEEEGMDLFRSELEAEALRLAAASFEAEVRRLVPASTAVTEVGQTALPSSTSASSPKDRPSSGLTRSQLDLRRVGRVRSLARALGEVLHRGREALVREVHKVVAVVPVSEDLTPYDGVLGGLDDESLYDGFKDAVPEGSGSQWA